MVHPLQKKKNSHAPIQTSMEEVGSTAKSASPPSFSLSASPVQMKEDTLLAFGGGDPGTVYNDDYDPANPNKAATTYASGFSIGAPQRPNITHDNGHLDAYDEKTKKGDPKWKERAPTWSDRAAYAKWSGMAEAGAAFKNMPDAVAAYRHFLGASGQTRTINYDRYVQNDSSGATTLQSAINYTKQQAEALCPEGQSVSITSQAWGTGRAPFTFPYPATENWQKAIGAHKIWISANVTNTKGMFTADITVHFEDMYNFNPGAADIATGIPDSDNGLFEITKLAKQYLNVGSSRRTVSWKQGDHFKDGGQNPNNPRNRRERGPRDGRRARERA